MSDSMNCEHKNMKTLHETTQNRICLNCYQHWYDGKEYTRKEWNAIVDEDVTTHRQDLIPNEEEA